ncbi:MAG TPA: hypothetical protein VMW83_01320 [Spirochaetia bacterium]|nr:hypothetical protein [Spirochaetia bacterium]
MADQMRNTVICTLDAATLFLESIQRDFQKNKLRHRDQVSNLNICFQNLLNLSTTPGGEFDPRIRSLQGSLLVISSAVGKKVEEHILFSNRAVEEIRCLFTESLGFLKTAMDFLKTDNSILLRWLENKQTECRNYCDSCSNSHEERLIEGSCVPAASLLYLDMLRGFNDTHWQVINVIGLLAGLGEERKIVCSAN